jgi:plastocyanin
MFRRPAALLLIALVSVGACGGGAGAGSPAPGGTPAGGAAAAISIVNFAFAPADLTIAAGTTVTWTNEDQDAHVIKSTNGVFVSSASLGKGDEFAISFPDSGTFPYLCAIHPTMTGTITVTP